MLDFTDVVSIGSEIPNFTRSVFQGNFREAWIRAYMEAEPEKLDEVSQIWFIEDEDVYKRKVTEHIEATRYGTTINAKMLEYFDELDDE